MRSVLNEIEKNQNSPQPEAGSTNNNAYPYWHLGRLVVSLVACVLVVIAVAGFDKCG